MFKFVAAALMVMGSVAFANETAPAGHETAPATAPAAEAPKADKKMKTKTTEKTTEKKTEKKTEGHGH